MITLKKVAVAFFVSAAMLTNIYANEKFTPSNNKNLAVEYTIDGGNAKSDKEFF